MPRRGSRIVLLVSSVLLLVAGMGSSPTARASLPRTGSNIHRWEPEYMATNHVYSKRAALRHARRSDVIVALRTSFERYVPAMKKENTHLTLLVYLNGGYSMHDNGSKYPSSYYARDSDGNKIKSKMFGNYLMDVSSAGWRTHVSDQCANLLSDSGYDGCFLDSLGPAALERGYVTGLPVNPSTGSVWTRDDWLGATHDLASVVKTNLGTRPLVINGVQQGAAYFDPDGTTGILADGIEGGMVELFIRPPFAAINAHRTVKRWRQDVNMLVNAGSDGRALLCVTKVWTSGTARQMRRRHGFALASFLLGTNGSSYFSFLDSKSTGKKDDVWTEDLGGPSGPYTNLSSGVSERWFANGLALVNPTDTKVRVRLSQQMRTLGGSLVSKVIVRPYRGVILVSP